MDRTGAASQDFIRYKELVDQLPQIVFEMDLSGKLTYVNRCAYDVMGYSEEDFSRGLYALDMVVPEDRDKARNNIAKAMYGEKSGNEYRFMRKDGSILPVILHSSPIVQDGKTSGLRGIVIDITDRKETEEELRKLSAAVEQSPSSVMVVDTGGKIVYVNPRFARITGYSSEEVIGKTLFGLSFVNARPEQLKDIENAIGSGQSWNGEIEYIKRSGRSSWVSANIFPIKNENGSITHFIDVEEDITDRKLAEAELRKLTMAIDQSPASVTIADCDGNIAYVNPSFTRMTGFSPEKVIGKRKIDFLQRSTPGDIDSIFVTVKSGKVWKGERRFVNRDGREGWISALIAPVRSSSGEVTHFVITESDISERKRSEDELRKLSAAVQQSPASVKIVDLKGRIVYVNPKFTEMSGFSQEELTGVPHVSLPSAIFDHNTVPHMLEAIRAGKHWHGELQYRKKSGEAYWVMSHASPIRDESGAIVNFIEISEDITERKYAEEHLKSSLREKEILLKEVHHRVKNNMQIISSLLNLHIASIDQEPVVHILVESQNRIRSIALVHERIYMSEDLAKIDFLEYLETLSNHLLQTYASTANNVTLTISGDRILLGVDQAVPCGLIMNELISNCLKHAFHDMSHGTINIILNSADDNSIVIEDDGVGLPGNFSLAGARTIGMQLITALVGQLDGTVKIDGERGTRFKVSFPVGCPNSIHDAGRNP